MERVSWRGRQRWPYRIGSANIAIVPSPWMQMCKPVRASAPAAWADSTEGRVCIAARNVAQWVRKPSQDHETFQAGWK